MKKKTHDPTFYWYIETTNEGVWRIIADFDRSQGFPCLYRAVDCFTDAVIAGDTLSVSVDGVGTMRLSPEGDTMIFSSSSFMQDFKRAEDGLPQILSDSFTTLRRISTNENPFSGTIANAEGVPIVKIDIDSEVVEPLELFLPLIGKGPFTVIGMVESFDLQQNKFVEASLTFSDSSGQEYVCCYYVESEDEPQLRLLKLPQVKSEEGFIPEELGIFTVQLTKKEVKQHSPLVGHDAPWEGVWGMSRRELYEIKGPALGYNFSDDGDYVSVLYNGSLEGKEGVLVFEFYEGRLISILYGLGGRVGRKEFHPIDANAYIDDFEFVLEFLKTTYGTPLSDKVTWHNNQYKNDSTKKKLAYAKGHVTREVRWQHGDRTNIIAVLDFVEGTLVGRINFTSRYVW